MNVLSIKESGSLRAPARIVASALSAAVLTCTLALPSVAFAGDYAYADKYDTAISDIGKAVEQKVVEVKSSNEDGALPQVDYTAHVGELMQNDLMLLSGCEVISLEIAIESMGFDVDLDDLVSNHLDMNGSFATGYSGDPYTMGGGFAPGIANAANDYLEEAGSSVRAHDITGTSFDEVSSLVALGYPVLTWTTMYFDDPYLSGIYEDEDEWYDNEHCVVLYGFSDDGETAYVSDPLEGYVEREASRFAEIYAQCGNRAVILY